MNAVRPQSYRNRHTDLEQSQLRLDYCWLGEFILEDHRSTFVEPSDA